ncbi:MAG: HNH endonuclease [Brevundimonas sp.]|uniref:HNH endonuclease n=1 Tax=Brevundimonas sp. TaxID=1871086 RepID=UPI00391D9059
MIKLKKSAKPKILEEKGSEWTKTLLQKKAAGEAATATESTRYRHPDIKEALVLETHNKCAYCESKLQHTHHGDVEHIMPKSLQLDKILEWSNLTLACEKCNQKKSNLDPDAEKIIDPYAVDPRSHFFFAGPFLHTLGTPEGISTKVILELDRPELIEMRQERILVVMAIFAEIMRSDIPLHARRLIYKNLLTTEPAGNKAYSAMIRDLIAAVAERVPGDVKAP